MSKEGDKAKQRSDKMKQNQNPWVVQLEEERIKMLKKVMSNFDEYIGLVNYSSKIHKHNFDKVLLMYSQNPNATAVASHSEWEKAGRGVKRGSRVIRIPHDKYPNSYDKYYDIADTYGKEINYLEQYVIPDDAKIRLVDAFGMKLQHTNIIDNFTLNFKSCINGHIESAMARYVEKEIGSIQNKLSQEQIEIVQGEDFALLAIASVNDTIGQKFGLTANELIAVGGEASLAKITNSGMELQYLLGRVVQKMSLNVITAIARNTDIIKHRIEIERNEKDGESRYEDNRGIGDGGISSDVESQNQSGRTAAEVVLSPADNPTDRILQQQNIRTGVSRRPDSQPRAADSGIIEGMGEPPQHEGRDTNTRGFSGSPRSGHGDVHTEVRDEHIRPAVEPNRDDRAVDGGAGHPRQQAGRTSDGTSETYSSNGVQQVYDGRGYRDGAEDGESVKDKRAVADATPALRQEVGEIYDGETPTDAHFRGQRVVQGVRDDVVGSDDGSRANEARFDEVIREEKSSPNDRGLYDDGTARKQQEDLRRGNSDEGDSLPGKSSRTTGVEQLSIGDGISSSSETQQMSWNDFVKATSLNIEEYKKPFVIFEISENQYIQGYNNIALTLDGKSLKSKDDNGVLAADKVERMSFDEANLVISHAEKIAWDEAVKADKNTSGYDKIFGVIFYRNLSEDNVLSHYEFRYDLKAKENPSQTPLYDHINDFWANVKKGLQGVPPYVDIVKGVGYSQSDIDSVRYMLNILQPTQAQTIENQTTPQQQSTDEIDYEGEQEDEQHQEINSTEEFEAPAENFTITTAADIGLDVGGTSKAKFNNNLTAIKLLKTIESQGRTATSAEQAILAKYSGFGGIPQAFDDKNAGWSNEVKALKEVTTQEEYTSLGASVLNAHYTQPEIIKAIYNGLERMGFLGGAILEPSMGCGAFFGAMPQNIAQNENTKLYGVELDDLTGRIAKQLYPEVNIEIKGFEASNTPNNFFDVVVGNIPFGNYGVHDPKLNKHNFMIHDYFFAKSLDKVRAGGVVAFITSSGTMDKQNTSARRYIAERAELLGAIRLPNTAFKQGAGATVTTDILFLKKRERITDATNEDWVYTGLHNTKQMDDKGKLIHIPINAYYVANPHMMLGEMSEVSGQFGKGAALLPFSQTTEIMSEENKKDWFSARFVEISQRLHHQNGELNNQQWRALEGFESISISKGYFNASIIETWPIPFWGKKDNAWDCYDDLFDGGLQEIVNYVELPNFEDKSHLTLEELLKDAIKHLPKDVISSYGISIESIQTEASALAIPADPNVKNHTFVLIEDVPYYRSDELMYPTERKGIELERLKSFIVLRQQLRNVIDIQLADCTDEELLQGQKALNNAYDDFYKKHKSVNASVNRRICDFDAEYPLVSSLENENEETKEIAKSDIFNKRTITPYRPVLSVETAQEALAVSLYENGGIDIGHMQRLTGKNYMQLFTDLQGLIFKNPMADTLDVDADNENILYKNWETADEFLSGNVADKLEYAKSVSNTGDYPVFADISVKNLYAQNISALEAVQPTPIAAHEISVNIGASWIDPKYYEEFLWQKLGARGRVNIKYDDRLNRWNVDGPYYATESIQIFGTRRMNACVLMETMLNGGQPEIKDAVILINDVGKEVKRYVVNREETIAIKEKQNILNEDFKKWIFDEPIRREYLTNKYNRIFNCERAREYDGSFLRFAGMNPTIMLNKHQKDAVARSLLGGNTLLAHCVGAGKTYTMATTAMEMRRLGIANKPGFVVPNHIVNQWTNEFMHLYSAAKILTATTKDFTKDRRKLFMAKIATGDWDAIIMPQSFFERIPVSKERQEAKMRNEIRQAREYLEELKRDDDSNWSKKQVEASLAKLQKSLKELGEMSQDNVITFEETGIDALFVDEAHSYKNKNIFSKKSRIAGLVLNSDTKRVKDMEMKVEYINEVNYGEKNVVFATGTPVSNSMAELYTMQSYLQPQKLKQMGHHHFDNWAADYGKVVSRAELAPNGKTFRTKERFSQFDNVHQMMNTFRMVADIKIPEMLNLNIPKLKGGKPTIVSVEASEAQQELVKGLVRASELISKRVLKPEIYNMLVVTHHGALGALDMRTIDIESVFRKIDNICYGAGELPLDIDYDKLIPSDTKGSKINTCVDKVFDIYKDTTEPIYDSVGNVVREGKLTQMIFCDRSTPNNKGVFSVYDDIKQKLIAKGIKESEIVFIHDAKDNAQKEKIFAKMRTGEVRILLGSTHKMGTGTNAQRLLVALHNLDAPWRPSDLEQRGGRILRQGNLNDEVEILNYVTKGTFDSYLWQIIEGKQRFISQVMSGDVNANTIAEADELTLNYAEVKAIATGQPEIIRKMELEAKLSGLKVLEQQHTANRHQNQDAISKTLPNRIAVSTQHSKNIAQDIITRNENSTSDFVMKLGKNNFVGKENKKAAGELILKAVTSNQYAGRSIGTYKGFSIVPSPIVDLTSVRVTLQGATQHNVELSNSGLGAISRIDYALKEFEKTLEETNRRITESQDELDTLKTIVDAPFEYEKELYDTQKELIEVNAKLNIGQDSHADVIGGVVNEDDAITAGVVDVENVAAKADSFEIEM